MGDDNNIRIWDTGDILDPIDEIRDPIESIQAKASKDKQGFEKFAEFWAATKKTIFQISLKTRETET